jgi:hypothetical protein
MDPFALALDALFSAPGSKEVTYYPKDGPGRAGVRVIFGQPDKAVGFGEQQIIEGTNVFEIRVSDVSMPAKGDIVVIGDVTYKLLGEPMLDVEGLTWTIGGSPVA